MGFFSNVTRSWKKSSRLAELQKTISPPNQSIGDLVANAARRDQALEEFLDLCESDEGVQQVMKIEGLSRSDLKQMYVRLSAAGLGQWIKGHHVALSSIAYVEPLQYVFRAQKHGVAWMEVVSNLLAYWEGQVPQGALLNQVR